MAKKIGTKSWVVAAGAALLLAFVVVPALSGAASASPVTGGPLTSPGTPWAYGGQGWSNHTVTIGNTTVAWHARFGWTAVFNSTPTAPNVTMLSEVRTVGMTISMTYQSPAKSAHYFYHAQEVDTAFANVTNLSVVYVSGQAVPALGLMNSSASVNASIAQSLHVTHGTTSSGASLRVSELGNASVSFAPSLGLVPLNTTGISQWNSSAMASPSAAWDIDWSWSVTNPNGTNRTGSSGAAGNLSGTVPVSLRGFQLGAPPRLDDHMVRVGSGISLVVRGPFELYDGFVLIPHGLDLFGGASQGFDSYEIGSANLGSQMLYFSHGIHGLEVRAAATTFGSASGTFDGEVGDASGVSPAASFAPGTTVLAQPMSVGQAQAEASSLLISAPAASGSSHGGAFLLVLFAAAVAAVAATVVVVGRSGRARRTASRYPNNLSGRAPSWQNGTPPSAPSPGAMPGSAGTEGGAPPIEDPRRPL